MIGHTFKQTEITTSDYQLRWWRLPIEENAYRKTLLGGGDYQLRTSALLPQDVLVSTTKTHFLTLKLCVLKQ